MKVKNFLCEKCRNMEMCSGYKTIKKFDEDYTKNPLFPDITVDYCPTFAEDFSGVDEDKSTDDIPDRDRNEIINSLEDVEI